MAPVTRCRHRHGTRGRYQPRSCHIKCRCQACCAALREYNRELTAERRGGIARMVPAGPVMAHLQELRRAGVGFKRVAELSGIAARHVYGIRRGEHSHVLAFTAEALLAVSAAAVMHVPVIGTIRRLQALCALGYGTTAISQRLGFTGSWANSFLRHHANATAARGVHIRTAAKVGALYDELQDDPGPVGTSAKRARLAAERRGYEPREAWTDLTIDDPDARPWQHLDLAESDHTDTQVILERVKAGNWHDRLTIAQRRVVVAHLATGSSRLRDEEIARRAGISSRTVLRIRGEIGIPAASSA